MLTLKLNLSLLFRLKVQSPAGLMIILVFVLEIKDFKDETQITWNLLYIHVYYKTERIWCNLAIL